MTTQNIESKNRQLLVADIAWFGVALAALSRFNSIYAIRLGANDMELSLIAALPGAMLLFSTGLTAWWRSRFNGTVKAMIWPSMLFRLVFLLPAFAPFFPTELQPFWLILAVTIPALPQGIANSVFVLMLRESVSTEKLTPLNSNRTLALNITVALGAIAFGFLLKVVPYPYNYQLMFVIAFGFAMLSHVQVTKINVIYPEPETPKDQKRASAWSNPGMQAVALVVFMTHVAFFSIVMVTPVRLVEQLGADEGFMALFGLVELAAGATMASMIPRIQRWLGTPTSIAVGMIGAGIAAWVIGASTTLYPTLIAAAMTGGFWTLSAVNLFTLLVERTPVQGARNFAVAYQQMVALGVFIGPMMGWVLLELNFSVINVLFFGAMLRILAGLLTYQNPVDFMPRDSKTRVKNAFLKAAYSRGRRR